jgi:hypothetical protein
MRKICIGIVMMLLIPAFAISASTEESGKQLSANDVVMTGYENGISVDLIADGGSLETGFVVGNIYVWHQGSDLHIDYTITEPDWEMTLTHVHIGDDLDDFPLTKQGNPQVGKFDYQYAYDPPVTSDSISIPYNGENMIAVHADVQTICGYEADIVGFEANLPAQVTFKVTYPYGGGPAYFPHTYITGFGGPNDTQVLDIYSWCVDTDHTIGQNTWYTANVYSSFYELPVGLVEYPDNLDQVNWILNQEFVGQPSPGCGGVYTYGDVQRAIWELVEDNPSTSGLGAWSQCRVNELIAAANASGEGYMPSECGDVYGIILAPVNNQQVLIAQAIIGEVGIPCIEVYCGETAWAGELEVNEFPGRSWAMYFNYNQGENNNPVGREYYLRGLLQQIFARILKILENLRVA